MKLQILVPQYKETEEIIRPLLDSIAIQQNVDLKSEVGVIIVNDGTDGVKEAHLAFGTQPFAWWAFFVSGRGLTFFLCR